MLTYKEKVPIPEKENNVDITARNTQAKIIIASEAMNTAYIISAIFLINFSTESISSLKFNACFEMPSSR